MASHNKHLIWKQHFEILYERKELIRIWKHRPTYRVGFGTEVSVSTDWVSARITQGKFQSVARASFQSVHTETPLSEVSRSGLKPTSFCSKSQTCLGVCLSCRFCVISLRILNISIWDWNEIFFRTLITWLSIFTAICDFWKKCRKE